MATRKLTTEAGYEAMPEGIGWKVRLSRAVQAAPSECLRPWDEGKCVVVLGGIPARRMLRSDAEVEIESPQEMVVEQSPSAEQEPASVPEREEAQEPGPALAVAVRTPALG